MESCRRRLAPTSGARRRSVGPREDERVATNANPEPSRADLASLLSRTAGGDPTAGQDLLPLVYDELRRVAAGYLRQQRPDHTLQPTALVHEAYLRLIGPGAAEP